MLFDVNFPAGAVAGAAAFLWVVSPASFGLLLLLAPPLLLSLLLALFDVDFPAGVGAGTAVGSVADVAAGEAAGGSRCSSR